MDMSGGKRAKYAVHDGTEAMLMDCAAYFDEMAGSVGFTPGLRCALQQSKRDSSLRWQ